MGIACGWPAGTESRNSGSVSQLTFAPRCFLVSSLFLFSGPLPKMRVNFWPQLATLAGPILQSAWHLQLGELRAQASYSWNWDPQLGSGSQKDFWPFPRVTGSWKIG